VTNQGVEMLLVVLYHGDKRESHQFGEVVSMYGQPETQIVKLLEALLGMHALIMFEGIVPLLCCVA
jgi:hypothetical protein